MAEASSSSSLRLVLRITFSLTMKFNVFVTLAALAFGSSLVLAAPVDFDMQDLVTRETYEVEDFVARDIANEFEAREIPSVELKAREDVLEDLFARQVCSDHKYP